MNPHLHPSQEGKLQTLLEMKLPSSEGLGVGFSELTAHDQFNMKKPLLKTNRWLLLILAIPVVVLAWDYEGHRLVNELALLTLPKDFPPFVHSPKAKERIVFLSGEPDRWRNSQDLPFRHATSPDHYIDLEELADYGVTASNLSHFRFEFAGQLATGRASNSRKFPAIDPNKDPARTRSLIGFLPWTITESYSKLKSAFSYLRVYEELGTPDEIENARQNVLYLMGVMGHFVGDAAQPLHTTKHFNGWFGANPHGYTTNRTLHSWIDGGFFQKAGLDRASELQERLRPAQLLASNTAAEKPEDIFPEVMRFILDQHRLVEPLYQLEKEGKLSGEGEAGLQGREFLRGQVIKAGQMLGDLWYSAWKQAGPDTYLREHLLRRKAGKSD
ncbi:MAG: hypothetical protein HYY23_15240 [Verrucomicrobia bacterium]|nr:hypothetical protein [Verrucomicrobiota bacterium]